MLGLIKQKARDQRYKKKVPKKSSVKKVRVSGKRKSAAGKKPKQAVKDTNCKSGYGYNPATGRCVKLKAFGPVYNGPCRKGYAINLATGRCHKI